MLKQLKRKIGRNFYRGGIFHHTKNYSEFVEKFSAPEYMNKKIINVGSGGHDQIKNAINIDPYRAGPNTIRAFGENMPFGDNTIDVALCLAVLEHVKEPEKIVSEIKRVLRKKGEIYIEIPFLQPFHAAPEDYHRWTIYGLKHLLKDFEEIESGIAGGPGSAVAWILVETSQIIFDNKVLNNIVKNLTKILVSPLKYLDGYLIKRPKAYVAVSALYFHGRKS